MLHIAAKLFALIFSNGMGGGEAELPGGEDLPQPQLGPAGGVRQEEGGGRGGGRQRGEAGPHQWTE